MRSAVNRRAWGNGLRHVLDARTGAPATDVVATGVVAGDAALADGLATALFFTGAHQLAEIFRFAYVRMLADASLGSPPIPLATLLGCATAYAAPCIRAHQHFQIGRLSGYLSKHLWLTRRRPSC